MKKTRLLKLLSFTVCIVLIAAIALFATSCNDSHTTSDDVSSALKTEVIKVGAGDKAFGFTVVDLNGNETKFEVFTNKTTVGEALIDAKLISGEEGPYGLYVKTVNGTTLDFDQDGMYWSFYINGEYATSGVDKTDIVLGESYSFKAEK